MILFHDIVQIFGVPDDNGGLVSPLVALDCGGVAATLINGDLFRKSLVPNRLA
jgi:hypothetical protein